MIQCRTRHSGHKLSTVPAIKRWFPVLQQPLIVPVQLLTAWHSAGSSAYGLQESAAFYWAWPSCKTQMLSALLMERTEPARCWSSMEWELCLSTGLALGLGYDKPTLVSWGWKGSTMWSIAGAVGKFGWWRAWNNGKYFITKELQQQRPLVWTSIQHGPFHSL